MSEKIRGFISRECLLDLRAATHKKGEGIKLLQDYVEVEITIIEPVYEYKVLVKIRSTGVFFMPGDYYKDLKECQDNINTDFEAIRLIEETKRIRK